MEYPRYTGSEPCAQVGGEFFFSDEEQGKQVPTAIVRSLCGACEMLEPCREYAIHHSVLGFWGGLSERERQRIRARRNITPIQVYESA